MRTTVCLWAILALALPSLTHGSPPTTRTYRPEVEFFVTLSELEVAEAVIGPVLNSPSGKDQMQALRRLENFVLAQRGNEPEWDTFWSSFVGSAAAAISKHVGGSEAQNQPQHVKLWMALEAVQMMLVAYRPLETTPATREQVLSHFYRGVGSARTLQNKLKQGAFWSPSNDDTATHLILGYKLMAWGNRSKGKPGVPLQQDRQVQSKEFPPRRPGIPRLQTTPPLGEAEDAVPKDFRPNDLREKDIIKSVRTWYKEYRRQLANYVCEREITTYDFSLDPRTKLEKLEDLLLENRNPGTVIFPALGRKRSTDTVQIIGNKEAYELQSGNQNYHKYNQGFIVGILGGVLSRWNQLHWLEDGYLRGRPVHIISTKSYALLRWHFLNDEPGAKIKKGPKVGFKGRLYVERGTGKVLRFLARDPIKIKRKSRLKDVSFVVDYDDVRVGNDTVHFPIGQMTVFNQDRTEGGMIVKLHNCRRFGSDVKLTFEQ